MKSGDKETEREIDRDGQTETDNRYITGDN